ncbi:hypothetical protein [Burkholderia gladioli]|uniref:hypothetical protein n=1 Tax=Burkholderia gladioli TaxID=28095 RepID=UPI001641D0CE|nr:hypothetical protein [Burkholderia gladioli]MDN7716247.1 hypothetical protein [Burkholderia gladioli]
MDAPDHLRLVLWSSTNDDPFVGNGSQYALDIKTFLTAVEEQGGRRVPPRLTMDSVQIQTVVEFAQILGPIFGPAIAAAVTTWLQGRAGRKIRLKVGDVEIEASTSEDFERLLSEARALKAAQVNRPDAHDEPTV